MGRAVYPIAFKPDLAEAATRYEAYYAGEIVDRPVIRITAPKDPSFKNWCEPTYWDRVYGDMGEVTCPPERYHSQSQTHSVDWH